jgi:hypothetical protein
VGDLQCFLCAKTHAASLRRSALAGLFLRGLHVLALLTISPRNATLVRRADVRGLGRGSLTFRATRCPVESCRTPGISPVSKPLLSW